MEEEVPIFNEEAMDRINRAVRDVEDMKAGFPNLVRELLPELMEGQVTINVVQVIDEVETTPGHWLGKVLLPINMAWSTKTPLWAVLKDDTETINHRIFVMPLPGATTLAPGYYVGVLYGVTEQFGIDDEEPPPTEVYLAIGAIGTSSEGDGSGTGLVIRSTENGPGPVLARIQTVDTLGVLIDDPEEPDTILVSKYPAPARENFELNGRYPTITIVTLAGNTFYFAETGPKTICEEVVTKDSVGHLDCTTLNITFTNTKLVRVIDPCLSPTVATN